MGGGGKILMALEDLFSTHVNVAKVLCFSPVRSHMVEGEGDTKEREREREQCCWDQ